MKRTYREQFDSAMACKTKKEAAAWLIKESEMLSTEEHISVERAKELILSNLGYIAGYYDSATAHKVADLFGAVHPVFKTATYFEDVTPREAFNKGVEIGRELKRKEGQ